MSVSPPDLEDTMELVVQGTSCRQCGVAAQRAAKRGEPQAGR